MIRHWLHWVLWKTVFRWARITSSYIELRWKIALYLVGDEFHTSNLKRLDVRTSIYLSESCPVRECLAELLSDMHVETPEILDVGAGPFSKVGRIYNGKPISLHAIDPLAATYRRILISNHIVPPVFTEYGTGEEISVMFGNDCFDLVYARNCIDHSADPIKIIWQIIRVLKRHGYAYLDHYLNEGEKANYYGLHLWNFGLHEDMFVISSMNQIIQYVVDEELRDVACVSSKTAGDRIISIIQKK